MFAECFDDAASCLSDPLADDYLAGLLRRSSIVALVARSHRRQGIASGLIAPLCAITRECGASAVQADHGDGPTIARSSGPGACEDMLHFDILP